MSDTSHSACRYLVCSRCCRGRQHAPSQRAGGLLDHHSENQTNIGIPFTVWAAPTSLPQLVWLPGNTTVTITINKALPAGSYVKAFIGPVLWPVPPPDSITIGGVTIPQLERDADPAKNIWRTRIFYAP